MTTSGCSFNPEKTINAEYHQKLKTDLAKHDGAMAYRTGPKRGLEIETIQHFGLGLSAPFMGSDGIVRRDALVTPMRSPETGKFLNKSAYICIPDVTLHPMSGNGWMKGMPFTYYADANRKQTILFVCEGLNDTWRHWQALSKVGMTEQIMLISSTHGAAFPVEWKTAAFWAPWKTVFLGQDNDEAGNKILEHLIEFVGREVRRILLPREFGKDWTDFWQNGGDIEVFRSLLDEAPVASGTKVVL